MKIAIIGSFTYQIPLEEGKLHAPLQLTYNLAEKLASYGHDVTFFGLYDKSKLPATRLKYEDFDCKRADKKLLGSKSDSGYQRLKILYEQGFVSRVFALPEKFDLFYSWGAYFLGPFAKFTDSPVVASHHDSSHLEYYNEIFEANFSKNFYMVPISKYIRTKLNFPASNFLPIIHNGVDEDKIKFVAKPDDYFSWAGRIIPSKGLHIALNLSEKLDIKLKIAGPHGQFSDSIDSEEYFTQIIERINQNPNTEYLGALPHEELCDLMAHSKGLIFPTDGNETFPMIVLEAMMGGTPVITLNKGPLPESITDQENGFLCENEEEMAKAITQIDTIERGKCRLRAEKDFSLEVMSRKYESAFKEVLNSRT